MKTYTQKITFRRRFIIQAKNAEQANKKLDTLIEEVEFVADVECDGFYTYFKDSEEDED
jgi:hypothetical protein